MEPAKTAGVQKSLIVMLNLTAWMGLIAAAGLGAIHFNECPVQPHIPLYLIMIGVCGVIMLILAYIKNTLDEGALGQLCTICISFILLFSICWILTGTFWVYSVYPPNYDSSNLRYYCRRTLYLFAFWFNTLCYLCVFVMFTACTSYLLYKCVKVAFCL